MLLELSDMAFSASRLAHKAAILNRIQRRIAPTAGGNSVGGNYAQ